MEYRQIPNPAKIYHEFLGSAIAAPWVPELIGCAGLRSGECVLDVACGTGIVARHVAPIVGVEGSVVALDFNPAMLAVARELAPPAGASIEWLEGNAMCLALQSGLFDLVFCQQGLQFFPDRVAALREMRRVINDGGRVVLSVWQALTCHQVYETLLEAAARYLGATVSAVASAFSLWNADELRLLMNAAGFHRIDIISKTLDSHFPSPERFVEMTLLGAAAVVPVFAQLDAKARCELAEAVKRDVAGIVHRYSDGDRLTFPMSAHIVVGYA